jgi:hypothetical protein
MRLVLFLCTLFISSYLLSQSNVIIQGVVCFQDENVLLEGATITIQDHNNLSNKSVMLSDSTGCYSILYATNSDSLILTISYPFCINHVLIIVPNKQTINLSTIVLQEDELLFEAVEVIAKRKPITVRNDTTIFNAETFMTDENDMVEGLLEVLPGITVDSEGNIFANGFKVHKVLVDGQPFFGSDFTIATRNLSQDLILSIEVFNTKTSSEEFIGSDGDHQNKTINLILRKDKKKGIFGEISGGLGTQNSYELNGMLNRFSGTQQIALVGSANNVNKPPLSRNRESLASSIPQLSAAKGIKQSSSLGFNYSNKFSDKLEVSSNYLMTYTRTTDSSLSNRTTILPESIFYTKQISKTNIINSNHRLNLGINYKATPKLLIQYKPTLVLGNSKSDNVQLLEQSYAVSTPINSQEQSLHSNRDNQHFTSLFSLTRLFGTKGGGVSLTVSNQNERIITNKANHSNTESTIEPSNNELRNQLIRNTEGRNFYSAQANYKLVLQPKYLFLTLGIKYNYKNTLLEQDVDQFDNTNSTLPELDFKRNTIDRDIQPEITFSLKKNKWRLNLSSSYLSQNREFVDHFDSINNVQQQFGGLVIASNFNFQIKRGINITGRYQLQNTPPLLTQVQTFPNLLNPLNVVVGNPNLKSSENHQFQFGVNSFSLKKNRFISFTSSLTLPKNQVIRKTEIDENFVSTSSYVNANGGYNTSTNLNYRKRISLDSLNTLNLEMVLNTSINAVPTINSEVAYSANSFSMMPNVDIEFKRKEWLKIKGTYRLSLMQTSFDFSGLETQLNVQQSAGLSTEFTLWNQLSLFNSTALNYNPNIALDSQKLNWIWNAGLCYFLKENRAMLSITLYDVLNSNASNTRSITPTYIENTSSVTLKRYLMFSASWKFRKM